MTNPDRRKKRTLTDADLEALRELTGCQNCNFSDEQVVVLKSTADNINTTHKVATRFIIYGLVATALGTIGFAIKAVVIEMITTGKIPGK